MGDELKQVLITADQLRARTGELAAQIDADYAGRDLLLVGVLKGAVMVMADLARAMHLPVQMDWMAISSYGSGTKSSGVVRILKDLDTDITDRHVLIVVRGTTYRKDLRALSAYIRDVKPVLVGVDGGAGFAHGSDPCRCPGAPAEQAVARKIEYAVVPPNRQHGWRHGGERGAGQPVPVFF